MPRQRATTTDEQENERTTHLLPYSSDFIKMQLYPDASPPYLQQLTGWLRHNPSPVFRISGMQN
jgi:hypothetical protein